MLQSSLRYLEIVEIMFIVRDKVCLFMLGVFCLRLCFRVVKLNLYMKPSSHREYTHQEG